MVMSEANGTIRHGDLVLERAKIARKLIEDLGPGVTQEQHDAAMRAAGQLPYSEPGFYGLLWRTYPERSKPQQRKTREQHREDIAKPWSQREAPPAVDGHADAIKAQREAPADYLTRLVRFAVAVEAVGGTANARRMLDALDQLADAGSE